MSKKYVVVGGSSGIGLALTNLLTDQGHHVTVVSRSAADFNHSNLVRHIPYDVTSTELLSLDLDEIHGLAYCPGTINLKPFNRLSAVDFNDDFAVNVVGAVKAIQAALPVLKKTEGASIVLYSTVAVAQGMRFHASVAASKGAIEGLTKSLAAELAPSIRVNCIAPSVTDTPLAERLLSTEEKKEASAKRHPLNLVGDANDISEMTAFLLSEKSKWITGQIIGIDGGMSTVKMM